MQAFESFPYPFARSKVFFLEINEELESSKKIAKNDNFVFKKGRYYLFTLILGRLLIVISNGTIFILLKLF